jgi:hypothetical protein
MVSVSGKVVEQVNGGAAEKHIDKLGKEIHRVRQISWSFVGGKENNIKNKT